ncbi:MAG: hypothetical protein N2689_18340 [Verrucomicrobiae bacterium]|nr:hypothetical protein [Verrucomicrobiae bacterium]
MAANAGWWTMPDSAVDFPYGLRGSPADEAALKAALQAPLVVLLGTGDTDPNHAHLRRTPEALAQGPHRFARGQRFFAAGKSRAAPLGVPFGWRLGTAPGVAHSNSGMSAFAAQWLFGRPPITSRDPARARVLFGGDTSAGESYHEEYAKARTTSAPGSNSSLSGAGNDEPTMVFAVSSRILLPRFWHDFSRQPQSTEEKSCRMFGLDNLRLTWQHNDVLNLVAVEVNLVENS